MKLNTLNISFIGPSGSGKTTCYKFARQFLEEKGFRICRCDVALPLRYMQLQIYKELDLPDPGSPERPETFNQDGKLLSFLAEYFEPYIIENFKKRFNQIQIRSLLKKGENRAKKLEKKNCSICSQHNRYYRKTSKKLAIINTDCRNNAYPILKEFNFKFIKLKIDDTVLINRLKTRNDLSPFDLSKKIEQINQIKADFEIENNSSFLELENQIKDIIKSLIPTAEEL